MKKRAQGGSVVGCAMALLVALAGCAAPAGGAGTTAATAATTAAATTTAASKAVVAQDVAVSQDKDFGGVYIELSIDDFNALGFSFGDSVDIRMSNGYTLEDIPYYNGYYANVGDTLLVGYPGYPYVEAAINFGDSLWEVAGLSEGDTATVTLAEAGKHRATQEAFDIAYTSKRADYDSDVQFANYRALTGGSMTPGAWYRSASPVDNEYERAPYVNALMKQDGIGYVLNLSDSEEEIARFLAQDAESGADVSYFQKLHDEGKVGALDLTAAYPLQPFKDKLVAGLVELCNHEGPYLVHCIEGEDRTGFVCALLEALAGASYDEILADYMVTFDNYYRINEASDPEKYRAIVELNLNGMLSTLVGCAKDADMSQMDFSGPAQAYLREGGMTDAQIEALKSRL